MITLVNRYRTWVKAAAVVVVCLFTLNTLAWAYPPDGHHRSAHTLQVQSMFKPILDVAGWEHDTQVRIELACILSMALKDTLVPFQDINAEIDKWLCAAVDVKRKRILNVLSNPKKEDGKTVVDLEIFDGPGKGERFRVTSDYASIDQIQESEGLAVIERIKAEEELGRVIDEVSRDLGRERAEKRAREARSHKGTIEKPLSEIPAEEVRTIFVIEDEQKVMPKLGESVINMWSLVSSLHKRYPRAVIYVATPFPDIYRAGVFMGKVRPVPRNEEDIAKWGYDPEEWEGFTFEEVKAAGSIMSSADKWSELVAKKEADMVFDMSVVSGRFDPDVVKGFAEENPPHLFMLTAPTSVASATSPNMFRKITAPEYVDRDGRKYRVAMDKQDLEDVCRYERFYPAGLWKLAIAQCRMLGLDVDSDSLPSIMLNVEESVAALKMLKKWYFESNPGAPIGSFDPSKKIIIVNVYAITQMHLMNTSKWVDLIEELMGGLEDAYLLFLSGGEMDSNRCYVEDVVRRLRRRGGEAIVPRTNIYPNINNILGISSGLVTLDTGMSHVGNGVYGIPSAIITKSSIIHWMTPRDNAFPIFIDPGWWGDAGPIYLDAGFDVGDRQRGLPSVAIAGIKSFAEKINSSPERSEAAIAKILARSIQGRMILDRRLIAEGMSFPNAENDLRKYLEACLRRLGIYEYLRKNGLPDSDLIPRIVFVDSSTQVIRGVPRFNAKLATAEDGSQLLLIDTAAVETQVKGGKPVARVKNVVKGIDVIHEVLGHVLARRLFGRFAEMRREENRTREDSEALAVRTEEEILARLMTAMVLRRLNELDPVLISSEVRLEMLQKGVNIDKLPDFEQYLSACITDIKLLHMLENLSVYQYRDTLEEDAGLEGAIKIDIAEKYLGRVKDVLGFSAPSPGALRDIGDGGNEELSGELHEHFMEEAADPYYRTEDITVGGEPIRAKVLTDGPGWSLPDDMTACHFEHGGELVIVMRLGLPKEIRDEALYHEWKEYRWEKLLAESGMHPLIRPVIAHRLAAAEEVIAFGRSGLTPFHAAQLGKFAFDGEKLAKLLGEKDVRRGYHDLVEKYMGPEPRRMVEEYEARFLEAVHELYEGWDEDGYEPERMDETRDYPIERGSGKKGAKDEDPELVLKLKEALGRRLSGKKVLELGFGPDTGNILALREAGANVTAVDIDDTALDGIRQELIRRGIGDVSVEKMDFNKPFAFADGEFDAVIFKHILDFVPERNDGLGISEEAVLKRAQLVAEGRRRFFSECRRVLASGGIIAVADVAEPGFEHREPEIARISDIFYRIADIGKAAELAGFEIIERDRDGGRMLLRKLEIDDGSAHPPGFLRTIGDGGVEEIPPRILDRMKLLSRDRSVKVTRREVGDEFISARIIEDTVGARFPVGIYACHFVDETSGELVIVTSAGLPKKVREEAIYHEWREWAWEKELESFGREGLDIKTVAHRLAAAEEAVIFGADGLTPFHEMELDALVDAGDYERLRSLMTEKREDHHDMVLRFMDYGMMMRVQEYEDLFRDDVHKRIKDFGARRGARRGGFLRDIGDGGVEDIPAETRETLLRLSRHWSFGFEGRSIGGDFIYAKFVRDGYEARLPEGVYAYHFDDEEEHGTVIVTRRDLPGNVEREACYHEWRESLWEMELVRKGVPEERIKTIAHRLAAAEEVIAFGSGGLTPFHRMQLEKYREEDPDRTQALLDEDRSGYYELVEEYLGAEAREKVEAYERIFREEAYRKRRPRVPREYQLDEGTRKDLGKWVASLGRDDASQAEVMGFIDGLEASPAITMFLMSRLQNANEDGDTDFARKIADLIVRLNLEKREGRKILPRLLHSADDNDARFAEYILFKLGDKAIAHLINSGARDGHAIVRERCGEILAEMIKRDMVTESLVETYARIKRRKGGRDTSDFVLEAVRAAGEEGRANIARFLRIRKRQSAARALLDDLHDGGRASPRIGKEEVTSRVFERHGRKYVKVVAADDRNKVLKEKMILFEDDMADAKRVLREFSGTRPACRRLVLKYLELLQNSPPALYCFSELYRDLFAFASPADNVIAVHDHFSRHPIVLMHEFGEYLFAKGAFELEYLRDRIVRFRIGKETIDVELSPHARHIINRREKWPGSWKRTPHYLLRAVQIEFFGTGVFGQGQEDIELTQLFREYQREHRAKEAVSGPFKTRGGRIYYAKLVEDPVRMKEALDKWFSGAEERYWSRDRYEGVLAFAGHSKPPVSMVTLEDGSGRLLGISINKKGHIPFPEGNRNVWVAEYGEVSPGMRGEGLGSVMMAKRIESATDDYDMEYVLDLPDGSSGILWPEGFSEGMFAVHPEEDEEYRDEKKGGRATSSFHYGLGFRDVPVTWTARERDEHEKDIWLSISEKRAEELIERVRGRTQDPGTTASVQLDLFGDGEPFPQIGKNAWIGGKEGSGDISSRRENRKGAVHYEGIAKTSYCQNAVVSWMAAIAAAGQFLSGGDLTLAGIWVLISASAFVYAAHWRTYLDRIKLRRDRKAARFPSLIREQKIIDLEILRVLPYLGLGGLLMRFIIEKSQGLLPLAIIGVIGVVAVIAYVQHMDKRKIGVEEERSRSREETEKRYEHLKQARRLFGLSVLLTIAVSVAGIQGVFPVSGVFVAATLYLMFEYIHNFVFQLSSIYGFLHVGYPLVQLIKVLDRLTLGRIWGGKEFFAKFDRVRLGRGILGKEIKRLEKKVSLGGGRITANETAGEARSFLANIFRSRLWKILVLPSTVFHETGHILAGRIKGQDPDYTFKDILYGSVRGVYGPAREYGGVLGNLAGVAFGFAWAAALFFVSECTQLWPLIRDVLPAWMHIPAVIFVVVYPVFVNTISMLTEVLASFAGRGDLVHQEPARREGTEEKKEDTGERPEKEEPWELKELEGVTPMPRQIGGRKVYVIGDVHGDLDALRLTLEGLGLIRRGSDPDGLKDEWIGGTATVIQGGDVIDRGPKSIEALLYLRYLQDMAAEKGGEVVRLIGNHEIYYLLKHVRGKWKYRIDYLKEQKLIGGFNEDLYKDRDGEVIEILKKDIMEGRITAAHEMGGKVFSHGVIDRRLLSMLGLETGKGVSDPAVFSETVNRILRDSVEKNKYESIIFSQGRGVIHGSIKGLFERYFGDTALSMYGYDIDDVAVMSDRVVAQLLDRYISEGAADVDGLPFDQVVFHDPRMFRVHKRIFALKGAETNRSIVAADVGMWKGFYSGRGAVVYEKGKVYAAYPRGWPEEYFDDKSETAEEGYTVQYMMTAGIRNEGEKRELLEDVYSAYWDDGPQVPDDIDELVYKDGEEMIIAREEDGTYLGFVSYTKGGPGEYRIGYLYTFNAARGRNVASNLLAAVHRELAHDARSGMGPTLLTSAGLSVEAEHVVRKVFGDDAIEEEDRGVGAVSRIRIDLTRDITPTVEPVVPDRVEKEKSEYLRELIGMRSEEKLREFNGGRDPLYLEFEGTPAQVSVKLRNMLRILKKDDMVVVQMVTEFPDRTVYRTVMDTAEKLLSQATEITSKEMTVVPRYKLIFDYAVYPRFKAVYVHGVSLGPPSEKSPLRNKGIIPETFSNFARLMKKYHQGWRIAASPVRRIKGDRRIDPLVYFMQMYFDMMDGRLADHPEHRQDLRRMVDLDMEYDVDNIVVGLIPEPEGEVREEGPSTASLTRIGKELFGGYSPFLQAPLFEELVKVGIPFGMLDTLNRFNDGMPVLNNGIFVGALTIFAAAFIILHIFNRRGPPEIDRLLNVVSSDMVLEKGGGYVPSFKEDLSGRLDVIAEYGEISRGEAKGCIRSDVEKVRLDRVTMTKPDVRNPWTVLGHFLDGKERFMSGMSDRLPIVIKWGDNLLMSEGNHRMLTAWMMGERVLDAMVIEIDDAEVARTFEKNIRPKLEEQSSSVFGSEKWYLDWARIQYTLRSEKMTPFRIMFRKLAAPVAAAATGMIAALFCSSSPSAAIMCGVTAHLIINIVVWSLRRFKRTDAGYASIREGRPEGRGSRREKTAVLENVFPEKGLAYAADETGRSYELHLMNRGKVDVQGLKHSLFTVGMGSAHKVLIAGMLEPAKKIGLDHSTYTGLVGDLFGFTWSEGRTIGIHEALVHDPVALFDRTCAYLIENGILKIRTDGVRMTVHLYGARVGDEVLLTREDARAIMEEAPSDQYTLFSALRRELFGNRDKHLSDETITLKGEAGAEGMTREYKLGGQYTGGRLIRPFTGDVWIKAGSFAYRLRLEGENIKVMRYSKKYGEPLSGQPHSYGYGRRITVGRSRENNYAVGDPRLSRDHFAFCVTWDPITRDPLIQVWDLGSKGGTEVTLELTHRLIHPAQERLGVDDRAAVEKTMTVEDPKGLLEKADSAGISPDADPGDTMLEAPDEVLGKRVRFENPVLKAEKIAKETNRHGINLLGAIKEYIRKVSADAEAYEREFPVDIVVDLSLIPAEDLSENMETWAYLVLLCAEMKNVNFRFEKPDFQDDSGKYGDLENDIKGAAYVDEAMAELKRQLGSKALLAGLDIDTDAFFAERINAGWRDETIEVFITSKEWLVWARDTGTGLYEDEYPVALDGLTDIRDKTVVLRNFEAALTIGLAEAAMVMARRRDEGKEEGDKELPGLRKKLLERLQKLYSVFRPEIVLTENTLDNMIYPDKTVRINRAIELALPPITRMFFEHLRDVHENLQMFLLAA